MKRVALALIAVLLASTVAFAGNWNGLRINGFIGTAQSQFGMSHDFKDGKPIGIFSPTEDVTNPFTVFAIVTFAQDHLPPAYWTMRVTSPSGQVWNYTASQYPYYSPSEYNILYHARTFNLTGYPAGTYTFDIFLNGVRVGGIELTRNSSN
jgi:hypothetical protein